MQFDKKDLKVDYYRAQPLVNMDDTACRIIHLPTGIEVRSNVDGSRLHNKRMALNLLREALEKQDGDR